MRRGSDGGGGKKEGGRGIDSLQARIITVERLFNYDSHAADGVAV